MGSHEVIWHFLVSGVLGYIVFGFSVIVGVFLCTLVFVAACALADVEPPNLLFCLLIVLLTLVVCGPLVWGIVYVYKQTPLWDALSGSVSFTVVAVVAFVLCVAISSALYIPILRVSVKKGVMTGFFDQLLGLLLFSLIYGVVCVILAFVQIGNTKSSSRAAPEPLAARTVAAGLPS
jgi:hypothetical protein